MLRIPANVPRLQRQKRSRRQLPFPARPNLRIAQLRVRGECFDSTQPFSTDEWAELEAFRAHAIVGWSTDLQRLAELAQRRAIDLTSVDHAVFVLTCCGDRPVSDVSRVVLWQAFGVPVYELFVAPDGSLLASECEAHEGWHVEEGVKFSVAKCALLAETEDRNEIVTGLTGRIETRRCECGRSGPRILDAEPLPVTRVRRALAATA